jgi:hypothetical protein
MVFDPSAGCPLLELHERAIAEEFALLAARFAAAPPGRLDLAPRAAGGQVIPFPPRHARGPALVTPPDTPPPKAA